MAAVRTFLVVVMALAFCPAFMVAETNGDALIEQLRWRNIGPDRGGRSIAVAGSVQRPNEAFFGATGGGLWKTKDAGETWWPVTDGEIGSSSVGAVAVAPSDPDIVYLGMGEGQLRNNIMQGDGVYRSDDGGENWRHLGLAETLTITTIRVHPDDPDTVYVAALGDPYQATEDRGIYRSRDGGETWDKVLHRSPEAGAIDLTMDPGDPDHLIASLWQVYRKPWKLWSGGPISGLYESPDGGDTWTEITDRPGLPDGRLGKMTVAISPADTSRIYANIEAKEGGLYRSDDGGETWVHVNGARKLWQRSFYFMQVRPDPVDRDKVYVLSFQLERSEDGGETFRAIPTRHVDIHDLWIDPTNPDRMIVADDGGGSVTLNGGGRWSEQDYPTAQMYRVTTTNDFPYHVCGSQQDNTTVCVSSRTRSPFLQDRYSDYYTVGLSEMGYVAVHPEEQGVFFVGGTNSLARYDRETDRSVEVHPYPYFVMGQAAETMEDRWNWTFPIVFSHTEPSRLFAGSQRLWQSDDEGKTWEAISPDLSRADPETLGPTGGVVLLDQDGPEVYGTIFTIAPSRSESGTIWTGSDDGLLQITRNGGETWNDVTPGELPANSRVSFIDASHHDPSTAYVAVKRYEMGDRSPYLYRMTNYGEAWERLDKGLPDGTFVHAVREDPVNADILYIGTEHGV
ncbi:MAG: glycosyl hydrolase, partial [Pseudomonadota bacterium]